jgi:LPXTG-motif cell wall-anchored protein
VVSACRTDNVTPHYTLRKSTDDADGKVMPPYLGTPGTLITYTLTVHNDSSAPINASTMSTQARTVTDDLSDVLDNATLDESSITGPGTASYDPATQRITWILPDIRENGATGEGDEPLDVAKLTYQVRVAGDQWDETLTNLAAPGAGGDCYTQQALGLAAQVVKPTCTTTSVTPKYALIEVHKVDADNPQLKLPGAVFSLSHDGKVLESGVVSDAQGVAHFATKLQPGTFQVTETKAPAGYELPADSTQDVEVLASDLDYGNPNVAGAAPATATFADPPTGSLTLSKAHQELSGGAWVPGDGQVKFNDQVKYVITVTATGTKVFHDVKVSDYVPGYNPADTQTQLGGFKGVIDTSSVKCSAVFTTCTSAYDPATGLVTWTLGSVGNKTGTVEFVVRMPDLPRVSPLAGPGVSFAGLLWNQAYLAWTQVDDNPEAGPHSVSSNPVTDAASEVLPPKQQVVVSPPKQHHPAVLPNTGGPDGLWLAGGLALLLAGGALVLGDRRRRHRS